jgi:hypothetical protein
MSVWSLLQIASNATSFTGSTQFGEKIKEVELLQPSDDIICNPIVPGVLVLKFTICGPWPVADVEFMLASKSQVYTGFDTPYPGAEAINPALQLLSRTSILAKGLGFTFILIVEKA